MMKVILPTTRQVSDRRQSRLDSPVLYPAAIAPCNFPATVQQTRFLRTGFALIA